jgi:hypothetical protein
MAQHTTGMSNWFFKKSSQFLRRDLRKQLIAYPMLTGITERSTHGPVENPAATLHPPMGNKKSDADP